MAFLIYFAFAYAYRHSKHNVSNILQAALLVSKDAYFSPLIPRKRNNKTKNI